MRWTLSSKLQQWQPILFHQMEHKFYLFSNKFQVNCNQFSFRVINRKVFKSRSKNMRIRTNLSKRSPRSKAQEDQLAGLQRTRFKNQEILLNKALRLVQMTWPNKYQIQTSKRRLSRQFPSLSSSQCLKIATLISASRKWSKKWWISKLLPATLTKSRMTTWM